MLIAYLGEACDVRMLSGDDQAAYTVARRAAGIRVSGDYVTRPVRLGTAASDLVVLHQMLNWAATVRVKGVRLLDGNPLAGIRRGREQNPRRPIASYERFTRHALGDAGALCGGAKRSGSLALDRGWRDSRSWSAACGTLTVERGRRRASIFRSRRSRQPVARRTRKLCSPATSSHGLDVWTAEAEPQVDWSWALGPNVADYPASIFQISTRHRQRPSSCRQITTYFAAADCPPASVSVARPIS